MPEVIGPPSSVGQLREAILERYDNLSGRLKQVARYILDEPNAAALETLAEMSARCGAQPSAIVRFAQAFGFDGAGPMQRLLKEDLLKQDTPLAYAERARRFSERMGSTSAGSPSRLLTELVEGAILALPMLNETIDPAAVDTATRKIVKAQTVYVAGFRRSFAVAAYLAYSLQQSRKRAVLVDGVGGLVSHQAQGITKNDLVIAISFAPYAEETKQVVDAAIENGASVIAISDSMVSSIAKSADLVLQVKDAEVRGFRTLASSMCLVQALAIAYAFEHSGAGKRSAK